MSDLMNGLLRRMDNEDFEKLKPALSLVNLRTREIVVEANAPVSHVYFPESATCSIMAAAPEIGTMIEIGMVGREGMTDFASYAGEISPFRFIVQVPGAAWRVTREEFEAVHDNCPAMADLTRRYRESLLVQFGFSALSHGTDHIDTRLARWLLMSFDRTSGDEIPLVHDFIASMLAIRRSGVTTAIHILEGEHAIRSKRGCIQLLNRDKLKQIAGRSYGPSEAHFERLFGVGSLGAS